MLTHNQLIVDGFTDMVGLPRFNQRSETPHVLLFDQKWTVNIGEENGHLVIFGKVGTFPGKVPLLESVASAMSFDTLPDSLQWSAIAGTDKRFTQHLGLQQSSGIVILRSCTQLCDVDTISFREWLQEFVNHLENWATLMPGQNQEVPDSAMMPKPVALGTGSCMV